MGILQVVDEPDVLPIIGLLNFVQRTPAETLRFYPHTGRQAFCPIGTLRHGLKNAEGRG